MHEPDHLAPVIPLFGAATPEHPASTKHDVVGRDGSLARSASDSSEPAAVAEGVVTPDSAEDGGWRSTWAAPVTGARPRVAESSNVDAHPARGGERRQPVRLRALSGGGSDGGPAQEAPDAEAVRAAAEALLVRKLRGKSLSEAESRTILRGFDLDGQRLSGEHIDDVIDDFCRRGYIDDETLASLLVTSGVERRGQGRTALARLMAQRGISRETIDAALDAVPDDDYERALDFARSKMRSLARLDAETAKRRLSGQLARRGYPGGVVSAVLRVVIAESFSARPSSGVRFE